MDSRSWPVVRGFAADLQAYQIESLRVTIDRSLSPRGKLQRRLATLLISVVV